MKKPIGRERPRRLRMSGFTQRALVLFLAAGAFLLTMSAQTMDQAKLVGKWKLNLAKTHFESPDGPPPIKEGVLIISQATASAFKWSMTIKFMNGRENVQGFDGAIDGKPYPFKGAGQNTRLSFVHKNGVLEGTAMYGGGTVMHEIVTVSPDGNVMTSQSRLTSPSGSESWTEVWERVQEKRKK